MGGFLDGLGQDESALVVQDPLPRPGRLDFGYQHDDPVIAIFNFQFAQVVDDGRSQRPVAGVQRDQCNAGIPFLPLAAQFAFDVLVVRLVVANRHRDDLIAERHCRGDALLSQP